MSDILESFTGAFKYQDNQEANWLPVDENDTPTPHPAMVGSAVPRWRGGGGGVQKCLSYRNQRKYVFILKVWLLIMP